MSDREPNLARPWARHRVLIYLGVAIFTGLVFGLMTVGVGVGLIEPTFTSDVVANLLFGVPVILLPLVILWDAPGENRSRLEKAAELTLFYLPYTALQPDRLRVDVPHRPSARLVGADVGSWFQMAVVAVRAGRHAVHQWQPVDLRP